MNDGFLLAAFGAVIGALAGGGFSAWISRRTAKLQTTLDLFNEWHSSEMRKYRSSAFKFLKDKKDIYAAYPEADADGKHAISGVAHYWEKAALLYLHNETKKSIFKPFLKSFARYWSDLLFGASHDPKHYGEWSIIAARVFKLIRRL